MTIERKAKKTGSLAKDTISLWASKNAFQFAGAMAFYTLFSLAPLMVIMVSVAGMFFGEEASQNQIAGQLEALIGSAAAEAVENAVDQSQFEKSGILPTILGVGALLLGATTVFAQVQAGLNHLWEVKAHPTRSGIMNFIRTRLLSLGLVLTLGFLLLVSFALTIAIQTVMRVASDWLPIPDLAAQVADLSITMAVVTLLFAMIYKVLPDVHLSWRDMWKGALVAAALFTVGQTLITVYLTRTAPGSAYGAAGSLVLVLMWVYYSSLILLLGAAFTRVAVQERGDVIRPRDIAVKIRTVVVEEPAERRSS